MKQAQMDTSSLRYLPAERVRSAGRPAAGPVGRLTVRSEDGEKLGELDGLVIDPPARRLRFLIVGSRGWLGKHRYLLPLGPARLDTESGDLHVEVDKKTLPSFPEFDPAALREFSDEDVLTALFGSDQQHAA